MNHFLTSLTSPDSSYSIADTPISIVLITPHPIMLHMRANYGQPGWVKEQDPANQRLYRDAVVNLGKEWKEKERLERWNATGWRVETLDMWDVMRQAAGGLEDGMLERFYTYVFPLSPVPLAARRALRCGAPDSVPIWQVRKADQ